MERDAENRELIDDPGTVSAEYPEIAKYQYTGDFSELEPWEYSIRSIPFHALLK